MSQSVFPKGKERREIASIRALRFVRFSHTIFALPFAAGSAIVAAKGLPGLRLATLMLACMVFARTAAMAFNRLADWEIDLRNPRTSARHKLLSKAEATWLFTLSALAFLAASFFINSVCFYLAPAALVAICFYSFTKRFSSFSHFFLGFSLALSPVGAWLAVTGSLAWPPLILGVGVLFWVAGFDVIYATQDYGFDKEERLHSLVVKLGVERSLRVAIALHVAMLASLCGFVWGQGFGLYYCIGLSFVAVVIIQEHRIALRRDIVSINKAFFQSNALVGSIFFLAVCLETFLK